MAVTRLQRKARRNKSTSRQNQQRIKLLTSLETGDKSQESPKSQIVKNRQVIAELEAELNKK